MDHSSVPVNDPSSSCQLKDTSKSGCAGSSCKQAALRTNDSQSLRHSWHQRVRLCHCRPYRVVLCQPQGGGFPALDKPLCCTADALGSRRALTSQILTIVGSTATFPLPIVLSMAKCEADQNQKKATTAAAGASTHRLRCASSKSAQSL